MLRRKRSGCRGRERAWELDSFKQSLQGCRSLLRESSIFCTYVALPKTYKINISHRLIDAAAFDLNLTRLDVKTLQIDNVFVPAVGDRDSDDLRQNSSALFPPEFYVTLLHNATIKKLIGATSTYSECSGPVDNLFDKTGDVRFAHHHKVASYHQVTF